MKTTSKILKDSIGPNGARLTTFELEYPRIVHSELMTHRVFSRNAASSRAIPVTTAIKRVRDKPFVPKVKPNKAGMSPKDEPFSQNVTKEAEGSWIRAMEACIAEAEFLAKLGVHKQWPNRLLEAFSYIKVIVSSTDYEHFFSLRNDRQAQSEIAELANQMEKAYRISQPEEIKEGDWHVPLVKGEERNEKRIHDIAVARCARISYLTHDGKRDLSKDLELFERLRDSGHWSPFEHVARACSEDDREMYGNFLGWKQYRKFFENEYCGDNVESEEKK